MKSKLNLILVGESGRMGQEIVSLLPNYSHIHLSRDFDAKTFTFKSEKAPNTKNFVVIDFSSPEGLRKTIEVCVKNRIPLVSGTTGLSVADLKVLKSAGKKIPVLWSPNMSVGVNLLLNLIEKVGSTFKSYDLQITETHHVHKKDAPSGTAIALQKKLEEITKKNLPDIISIREGDVIGEHKIALKSANENIQIEHKALNRKVFAQGAIEAAIWLKKQKPKYYEMKDFINGRK